MCPATRACGTRRGRTPRQHAVSNTRGCAGDGAGLGAGQHPPVRGRPRPRHHQRPVRRQLRLHLPPRVTARQVGPRPRPGVSPKKNEFFLALTSRSVQGTVPARHSAERRGRLLALLPPLLRRARAQVRPARRARARLPQADRGRHRRVSPRAVRH